MDKSLTLVLWMKDLIASNVHSTIMSMTNRAKKDISMKRQDGMRRKVKDGDRGLMYTLKEQFNHQF